MDITLPTGILVNLSPDLINYIINFMDLPSVLNLLSVNKSLCKLVMKNVMMIQRTAVKNEAFSEKETTGIWVVPDNTGLHDKIPSESIFIQLPISTDAIFFKACKKNFFVYATYLYEQATKNNTCINMYRHIEKCCIQGHLVLAQWLIKTRGYNGKSKKYYNWFVTCCEHGHLELAQWLLQLCETDGYTKINIYEHDDSVFNHCLKKRKRNIAKWLAEIDSTGRYSRILDEYCGGVDGVDSGVDSGYDGVDSGYDGVDGYDNTIVY